MTQPGFRAGEQTSTTEKGGTSGEHGDKQNSLGSGRYTGHEDRTCLGRDWKAPRLSSPPRGPSLLGSLRNLGRDLGGQANIALLGDLGAGATLPQGPLGSSFFGGTSNSIL